MQQACDVDFTVRADISKRAQFEASGRYGVVHGDTAVDQLLSTVLVI